MGRRGNAPLVGSNAGEAPSGLGKRVHGALYLHRDALMAVDESTRDRVAQAARLAGAQDGDDHAEDWNVVKLEHARPHRISLLVYERFAETAFPALLTSIQIDLASGRVARRSFRRSNNPPILHRKELLLPHDHPERARFAALTAELEKHGAFAEAHRIGFKKAWEERLAALGLELIDHGIAKADDGARPALLAPASDGIERHRTAIVRDRLSAPMQALARHDLLSEDRSVLDYGCGQGDDVRALRAGGIEAVGWDPHFSPDTMLHPADIVNLGFVLNVIEEPAERREALRRAFDLSKQCLAVSALVVGRVDTAGMQPYRDGFVTRRGTFQKYFSQDELRTFVQDELGAEPLAVAPGLFFVFKDKLLEQRFLLDRQRRRAPRRFLDLRPPRQPRPSATARRLEALRPLLERLWQRMLDLGRVADETELIPELAGEVERQIGSIRKAQRLCHSLFDAEALETAAQRRRDDLSVYFALNFFNGQRKYSQLPAELQRDVKTFFASHARAQDAGRALLFSVGQSQVIESACNAAHQEGLGWLEPSQSLQLHSALIERLPAVLRCYVGCAAKLYGDVETADLVKIHIRSGKLTLLFFEDFDTSPLPSLRERIKVDMRTQRIDFFDYVRRGPPQLLYLKSRYMAPDQQGYEHQHAFDQALEETELFDFGGFGPEPHAFHANLASAGYTIDGFTIRGPFVSA